VVRAPDCSIDALLKEPFSGVPWRGTREKETEMKGIGVIDRVAHLVVVSRGREFQRKQ
jgi:hypothetical protein